MRQKRGVPTVSKDVSLIAPKGAKRNVPNCPNKDGVKKWQKKEDIKRKKIEQVKQM